MPQNKLSKHDKLIRELSDRIKHQYDFLVFNVPIISSKRTLGEIDMVGRRGNRFDIYEVKCSHRIIKARKQLKRAKKFLKVNNSNSYFYCGSSKKLVSV